MDENLARKVAKKKIIGNPLNPFANANGTADEDDDEVSYEYSDCHSWLFDAKNRY